MEFFGLWFEALRVIGRGAAYLIPTLPFWGALIFGRIFWHFWVMYVRADFISQQEAMLLEIKLPREILKSPLAMELFLNSLHQTGGEGDLKEKYWEGSVRPWFSLELVSTEGQIRFFIWLRPEWRKLIESQIYAQYSNVEIKPATDYTEKVPFDAEAYSVTGMEFKLSEQDAYPIKTYVDYGLDRDPKEEYKIDPMAPLLEFMGSLGKGEQAWLQIIVRAHKKKVKSVGLFRTKMTDWKEEGEELIEELMEGEADEEGKKERKRLTPGESNTIEAIERSLRKLPFDVGIRGVYLAEKDSFDKINVAGLSGSFKQYNSNDLNSFETTNKSDKFDIVEAYRLRSYFHNPYRRKPFVLSAEELATIYHFPGESVETPTFQRIPSKKAEPPTNLPT